METYRLRGGGSASIGQRFLTLQQLVNLLSFETLIKEPLGIPSMTNSQCIKKNKIFVQVKCFVDIKLHVIVLW